MKKLPLKAFILTLFIPIFGLSLEKLDQKYWIRLGHVDSPHEVIQYFAMTCPHCLSLFKKDFQLIKQKYIQTGRVSLAFHPVPLDSLTVQLMDCLSHLSEKQKIIFFEVLFDMIEVDYSSDTILLFMQEAMKKFEHPIPKLDEKDYIVATQAFKDAFNFIKQEDCIHAVPAIEMDKIFFDQQVPDLKFFEKQLKGEANAN